MNIRDNSFDRSTRPQLNHNRSLGLSETKNRFANRINRELDRSLPPLRHDKDQIKHKLGVSDQANDFFGQPHSMTDQKDNMVRRASTLQKRPSFK